MTGASKRGFDLVGIKGDPTIVALPGPSFDELILQPLRCVGNADLMQYFKRGEGNFLTL